MVLQSRQAFAAGWQSCSRAPEHLGAVSLQRSTQLLGLGAASSDPDPAGECEPELVDTPPEDEPVPEQSDVESPLELPDALPDPVEASDAEPPELVEQTAWPLLSTQSMPAVLQFSRSCQTRQPAALSRQIWTKSYRQRKAPVAQISTHEGMQTGAVALTSQ